MDTVNRRYMWVFFIILITVMVATYLMNTSSMLNKPFRLHSNTSEQASSYYVVKDTLGFTILETGVPVEVNDQYISENNVEYIITKVEGQNAVADILTNNDANGDVITTAGISWLNPTIPAQAAVGKHVVIYHTHTDESFVPTSGTASQPGAGDVFTVGNVLTDSLQKSGVSVTHSTNAHDPHDINAYNRSRKTLAQLLKEQPDAAYDIHRDSTPASAYETTINGVATSKVMMVVGRSNPTSQANLNYAKTIKAQADQLYPGLIRGIYMGKGSYNQDLYPTAMLFEIGTETIPVELPENAARFLGDVITHVLAGS